MSLGGAGEAERVYGTLVSANYFTVLGTRPVVGRLLQDDDDASPAKAAVAVISYELWQRRFNGDQGIAGRVVAMNGHDFTIVGVAPAGFQGTTLLKPDVWVPLASLEQAAPQMSRDLFTTRRAVWLVMGGRLAPGVTLAQAQQELNTLATQLVQEYPQEYQGRGLTVAKSAIVPGRTQIVGGFIALLMAISGLVLLIACTNVAGMLLARGAARRREIAVRLAMGAGRGRLVRQLLTESIVLFTAGGLVGIIVSRWLTSLLLSLLPQLPIPVAMDVTPDWRVVSFAIVVSLAAAILSGLAPALQSSRSDLVPSLKAEGLGAGLSRLRLRNAFVVGQVAMSILLVIGAGLFFRALQHASAIAPGFDERNVDVVSVQLALAGYKDRAAGEFVRRLLDRTRALPDIDAASAALDLPLDGGVYGLGNLKKPGLPGNLEADWNVVEPGYFRTLTLPLARGRDFTDADAPTSTRVAIVNEALARAAWPGEDPIGRTLDAETFGAQNRLTVVGVATDARVITLGGEVRPYIYVPMAQQPATNVSLVVKHRGTLSSVPQVRAILRELAPNLPITVALPLSEITAIGLVPQRIASAVAGSLGVVGLLLAAIGIYGVTSVCREPADARDRHPHRPRRGPLERAHADAAARPDAGARRRGPRHARRGVRIAADREPAVRHPRARSAHVRIRRRPLHRRHAHRVLPAGPTRRAGGSDGRFA